MGNTKRWVGMALAVGALMVHSPGNAGEPGTAASGEAAEAAAPGAAAVSAEQAAERVKLRSEALTHLSGAPRAKFEQMSDEELRALLDTPAPDALGEEQQEIRAALGKVFFERELKYQTGDIKIGDDLATLHLGNEFRYLNPADSEKLLVQGWGNPPGS